MSNFKFDTRFIGYPAIEALISATTFAAGVGLAGGTLVQAEDKVFGPGEFVLCRATAAIRQYGLVSILPVWDSTNKLFRYDATETANTANLGEPVGVAQIAATVAGQYLWVQIGGVTPINGTASVAAGTVIGITGAGQIGANSAGKQILNAQSVQAATATVVKAGIGASGDGYIYVPDTDGLFVGGFLSGTGVGTNAVVEALDPMGKWIKASVVNSAAISGNVTQTNNNSTIFYNVCHINRPFAQGAIT